MSSALVSIWTSLKFCLSCNGLKLLTTNSLPLPSKPRFLCFCKTCVLKILWVKEKLLVTSNFSCSHCVFYPFRELSAMFIKFKNVCKLFHLEESKICRLGKGSVWKSINFVIWDSVKSQDCVVKG